MTLSFRRSSILFLAAFALIASVRCYHAAAQDETLRYQEQTPDNALQLVRVYVPVKEKSDGFVVCFSRPDADSPWIQDVDPMPAKIGRNGLGDPGEKGEGNGKLPCGEWDLGYVFGFASDPPKGLKFPYRQVSDFDYWVDESDDPRYNHWVSGEEPNVSHEKLTKPVVRYDLVLTTLYNFHPVHPGKGSAIFLHVWLNPDHPTAGCVALDRKDVVKILTWLDPKKRPRIRCDLGVPGKND